MTLVRLEGVTCAYAGTAVLRDVDLEIAGPHFLGVVGPSGSGKTTLLRAVLGTVRPVAGRIWRRPDLRVGYVPQVEAVNWNFPVTVAVAEEGELQRLGDPAHGACAPSLPEPVTLSGALAPLFVTGSGASTTIGMPPCSRTSMGAP